MGKAMDSCKTAKEVVILIIVHQAELEWYERISLRQCAHVLGSHPIRLICPEGMDASAYREEVPSLVVDHIPTHWQSNYRNFARLKILPFLYQRYSEYRYVLFYELDAFVFCDDLLEWCKTGIDYLGAPWFEGYVKATPNALPAGVGNGGFSLRRTEAMLKVTRTWRYLVRPGELFSRWKKRQTCGQVVIRQLVSANNFHHLGNDYDGPEDFFWGKVVPPRFPWYRLATYEEARRFSFEANPRRLFRECDGNLPFGCHKWIRHDPEFWREPIENFGHEITDEQMTKLAELQ